MQRLSEISDMEGFQYHVEGLDVDIPWNIIRGTTYRPVVSVRGLQTDIPGRNGVFVPPQAHTYDAPTVNLTFALSRQPGVTLEAAVNNLVGAFARPGEVMVTRISEGQTTRAACRLVSMSEPDGLFIAQVATMTVVLRVPGVFFRGEPIISAPYSLAVDRLVDIPTLSGSTAPITDSVLRVRGPLDRVSATDPSTRTGISWSGDLAADQYLYLNTDALTARRTTAANAWEVGGEPVSGAVDYPVAGPLQIWPALTTAGPLVRPCQLQLSASGPRTTATEFTIRGRRAFL